MRTAVIPLPPYYFMAYTGTNLFLLCREGFIFLKKKCEETRITCLNLPIFNHMCDNIPSNNRN